MNKISNNTLVINFSHILLIILVIQIGIICCTYYINSQNTFVNYANSDEQYIAIFENDIIKKLNNDYENFTVERPYCLYGKKYDNVFHIMEMYEPKTHEATNISLVFDICDTRNDMLTRLITFVYPDYNHDKKYLGAMHTHPPNDCQLSPLDFFQYGKNWVRDKDEITGIMCGNDNFVFYTYKNFRKKLIIVLNK